jgi:hypothetical protein
MLALSFWINAALSTAMMKKRLPVKATMEVADSDATEAVVELPLDLKENRKASVVSLVPPIRFGHVNPGVTRGAYPTLRNFRFLSRLQLKTIVSLTPEPPIADLVLFAEMAGIKIVHFPIGRMAGLSESVQSTIMSAVNVSPGIANVPWCQWLDMAFTT